MKYILNILILIMAMTFADIVTPAYADDVCRNLYDPSKASAYYISDSGSITQDSNHSHTSDYIPAQPGTVYSAQTTTTNDGSNLRIHAYDANKNWLKLVAKVSTPTNTLTTATGTTPANTAYIRVSGYLDTNPQIEQGEPTAYQPYNPLCATCDGTVTNYVSATGTVSQTPAPTPSVPVEPVFYTQGDMVLRSVGTDGNQVSDSYDATTGKITRRVGEYIWKGTESLSTSTAYGSAIILLSFTNKGANKNIAPVCNYFVGRPTTNTDQPDSTCFFNSSGHMYFRTSLSLNDFKTWLAERYAAGNPVVTYYALTTPTEEDWNTEHGSSYCAVSIKIATTKYNEDAFADLITTLNSAITKVTNIVDTTVAQANSIGTLATTKQDRPADGDCPTGRKCLLVTGTDGKPHWYLIQE